MPWLDKDDGMTEEMELGSAADLPDGQMRQYDFHGESVLVCNSGGQYFAVEGTCPHRGAMLSQGQMADGVVVCPWHQWQFDLRTGRGITNPTACLKAYCVALRDGQLYLSASQSEGNRSKLLSETT